MPLKELNELLIEYLANVISYAHLKNSLPVECRERFFGNGLIYTPKK